ncbi:MAG: hypothetical protein VB047_12000 [Anaerotignum propionicum]|uniref:hypothetical protein n=1 Tax=Anaerotignum propionicum TaxID=28446 RepID=UPI002B20355C|nr:hypothetical protein [Anaerotignum propionicum]MEA5058261.1 hypothetical protein [Anaerotignum propionicum]
MKCSNCGLDGMISAKKLRFEGDKDPNTPTKAFYDMTFTCRNPNCTEFHKEIGTLAVPLD